MTDRLTRSAAAAVLLFRLSFSTINGRMNSIIYDPRLRRRDEWDGGRGWCRLFLYVGMGVGGVEGEWESGGSGSIGVRGGMEG